MKVIATDFKRTPEALLEHLRFPTTYFTGDSCGKCEATVNIEGGHGWFCPCGEFNYGLTSGFQILHDAPIYGNSRIEIQAAVKVARGNNDD